MWQAQWLRETRFKDVGLGQWSGGALLCSWGPSCAGSWEAVGPRGDLGPL